MNNLQPLKWVDTTKGVDRVYCEKTDTYIDGAVLFCSTLVADYVIRKNKYNDGFTVNYGGRTEPEYNTIDEAKNWCEFTHYKDKMQPYVKPDSITDIANWFRAAKPEPTIEDLCVQIGCMLEEVCEFFQGLNFAPATYAQLSAVSELYKSKHPWALDRLKGISYDKRIEIVDACCDINVTSVGVMQLLGGVDVLGAQREVIRSNNSKMVKGKFEFDENGKIMKPESYSKPDLTKFVEVTK